jgi:adhesin transport system outer membrane protein
VELVLNYNLYRGGADKARVNQYVAKLATAYDLRDKACRDIWQTGLIAQNDSQRLSSQIQFLAQHELSTSKAKQVYQQQFDIGQRSLLDLLDTENELYQARRALANAEYDLKLSAARKLAAGGELLDALKLRPLSTDMPETPTNADMEDEVLLCSVQQATMPTLDRAFSSRPPSLPVEPVRPLNRVVAAVAAPAAEASCKELPKVVSDWLAAWSGKDLTRYLATYSSNFVPANGMNRSKWEAMRKTRIGKQGDLTVSIGALEPLRCDAKTAEVSFPQQYGSVDYSDKVEKTLSLEKVQGVWKITKETVTKGRTY